MGEQPILEPNGSHYRNRVINLNYKYTLNQYRLECSKRSLMLSACQYECLLEIHNDTLRWEVSDLQRNGIICEVKLHTNYIYKM